MGNQFKSPFQHMGEPDYNTFQGVGQQRANAPQGMGQQANNAFHQPMGQQGGNPFQGMGQQNNNVFQPMGPQQGGNSFQGMGQQNNNTFRPMGQQQANPFQGMSQQGGSIFQARNEQRSNAAYVRNAFEQQKSASLEPQKIQKKRQQRNISSFASKVIGCCACLIILMAGGGYWYYQASAATPPANNAVGNQPAAVYKGSTPTLSQSSSQNDGTTSKLSPQAYSGAGTPPMAISAQDGLIVISISQQQLTVYDKGKVVYFSLVTTGQIMAYTPTGTFHVLGRTTNRYFGPPAGSHLVYKPEHINYAVQLTTGGIYIHDAAWRSVFGPGTNVPHMDPKFGEETGSHGCINTPLSVAYWLYQSIATGTTVQIVP